MSENYHRRRTLGEEQARTEKARPAAIDPEGQLRKGVCPKCNRKVGRGVRLHYASCEQ